MKKFLACLGIVSASVFGMDCSNESSQGNKGENFVQAPIRDLSLTSLEEKVCYLRLQDKLIFERFMKQDNSLSQAQQLKKFLKEKPSLVRQFWEEVRPHFCVRNFLFQEGMRYQKWLIYQSVSKINHQNKNLLSQGGVFLNLRELTIDDSDLAWIPLEKLCFPKLEKITMEYNEDPEVESRDREEILLSMVSESLRDFSTDTDYFDEFAIFNGFWPSILSCKNLSSLKVGVTCLPDIPDKIKNLQNLRVLDLNNCEIEYVPESIGDLVNLEKLNLGCNVISYLPESIGNLVNLKELNVYQNKLEYIPESIGNLVNLEKLNLGENEEMTLPLPNGIADLVNLKELCLENMNLNAVPENIKYLINLEKLDLSSNHISELSESVLNLVNLKELGLNFNNMVRLPKSIGNLINLEVLSILSIQDQYNMKRLKEVPIEITNLTNCLDVWDILLPLKDNNMMKTFAQKVDKRSVNLGLVKAINANNLEGVTSLVDLGADVDFELSSLPERGFSQSVVSLAVRSDYADILELLLKRGAKPKGDVLNTAMHFFDYKPLVTDLLIRYGADMNIPYKALNWKGFSPLMCSAYCGYSGAISSMLRKYNQVDIVQLLTMYKNKIQVSKKDWNEVVRKISSKMVNVNDFDERNMTALMYAITSDKVSNDDVRINMVKMLLEHGADPNVKADENSMLIYSLEHEYIDIARLLVEKGMSVKQTISSINQRNISENVKNRVLKTLEEIEAFVERKGKRKESSNEEIGGSRQIKKICFEDFFVFNVICRSPLPL